MAGAMCGSLKLVSCTTLPLGFRWPPALSMVGPTRWLIVDRSHAGQPAETIPGVSLPDVVVTWRTVRGARRPAVHRIRRGFGCYRADGMVAAVSVSQGRVTLTWSTSSGADHGSGTVAQGAPGPKTLAWSPDSQWLFVVSARDTLAVAMPAPGGCRASARRYPGSARSLSAASTPAGCRSRASTLSSVRASAIHCSSARPATGSFLHRSQPSPTVRQTRPSRPSRPVPLSLSVVLPSIVTSSGKETKNRWIRAALRTWTDAYRSCSNSDAETVRAGVGRTRLTATNWSSTSAV